MNIQTLLIGGLTALLAAATAGPSKALDENRGPMLPHAGLEVTTAFTSSYGPDAESYFKFNSVTADMITIGYSSTRGVSTTRNILIQDRQSSNIYVIGFADTMPTTIANTTSLGISGASLVELRSTGQTSLALAYDANLNKIAGQLTMAEKNIKIPLLVENQTVQAPAIHATGTFGSGNKAATADFYFLDNKNNPMMLQSTIKFSWGKAPRTEKVTRVTAGKSMQGEMEQTLATLRTYDTYGIHFDFDKATIRGESATVISEIAVTLEHNPTWTLQINGYTDSLGDPSYNQKLSAKGAAAVKTALARLGVAADRLQTAGYGAGRPKGNNTTLQGRALNRRVELQRTDR
jgi:outer membrane protein OmpA-like peptidoglycan-associated protein